MTNNSLVMNDDQSANIVAATSDSELSVRQKGNMDENRRTHTGEMLMALHICFSHSSHSNLAHSDLQLCVSLGFHFAS